MILKESLQPGDLNHLVLPLLSIDEFSSKIDDQRAIVVGFYCTDREPAWDLMRFIEGSNLSILDTECSPAPTPDGYYLVFVEFTRNRDFPHVLEELLEQVQNIAENSWQLKVYHHDDIVPCTREALENLVVLDQNQVPPSDDDSEKSIQHQPDVVPEEDEVDENEFWSQADVDGVEVAEDHINIHSGGQVYTWGKLRPMPVLGKLVLDESQNQRLLEKLLGSQYQVYFYEHAAVVLRGDRQVALFQV